MKQKKQQNQEKHYIFMLKMNNKKVSVKIG